MLHPEFSLNFPEFCVIVILSDYLQRIKMIFILMFTDSSASRVRQNRVFFKNIHMMRNEKYNNARVMVSRVRSSVI